jgi:hypothetical protein
MTLIRLLLFAASLSFAIGGQSPNRQGNLTVEEVVRLARAGFSEDLIITKIKRNGKAFDLSTDELLELKKEGVSDNIVKFLLDPSQSYSPPSSPAGGSPAKSPEDAKKYPEDAFANQAPSEPGLYLFNTTTPTNSELKVLLGTEIGKMPMRKGKAIAYLLGAAARTRTKATKPIFYLRLSEGTNIADFVLVALNKKRDRRELDVGPPGPKQQLKVEALRQFDFSEVGPRLFKLTTPQLDAGEYLFFLVGSAEPPKGIYGKGCDFGIDCEAKE